MDKLLELYEKFLQLKAAKQSSPGYTYNRYFADLLHLASDLNHAYVSARRPAVKELCRLAWLDVECERKRIRSLCEDQKITQQ